MDKVNLSVAVVPMVKEFQWSPSTVGTIQSSFFWGYVLMQIPGGMLATALGGKNTLMGGFTLFSLATCLIPLASYSGLPALLAIRTLVGIGEGATPPAATALIARWFGPKDRSKAFGLVGFAQNAGAVAGLLVAPFLIETWSWPSVFTIFGGVGMAWVAVWALLGKDPPESAAGQGASAEVAKGGRSATSQGKSHEAPSFGLAEALGSVLDSLRQIPWRAFLEQGSVWAIIIVHFCYNWGFYTLLAWTPTYFSSALGYELKLASQLSILPYVCVAFASVGAGYLADYLMSGDRGWTTTSVRRLMQCGAFVSASVFFGVLGSGIVPLSQPTLCVAVLSAAFVCAAGSFGGLFCSWADLSPKYAGPLNGLSSTAGALGGVMGNYVAGQLLDDTGDWGQAVFFPTMACFLVGAVVWGMLYEAREIDFDEASSSATTIS
eukprot:TRINITY_DN17264_c0_g1_i1.p1 TRINITY_DN17264_c0_g1~~TRINITY_DN17264_c0_g1_i1.p1  ORF type:complete len:435 (-),score=56.84 TRINITY_DN17264_c0_g1_i1:130-1434(-)